MDELKVKELARLAQLGLSDEEIKKYTLQLHQAIQYFDQIADVKTENISPLVTPVMIQENVRIDESVQHVSNDEILNCATDKVGNLYMVPPVI